MGLVQVNTTTITSATKTGNLQITGIDTEDVYLLAFNNLNVEADITMFLRFIQSGSVVSTANYNYAHISFNAGAAFGSAQGAGQTAINLAVVTDTTCYGNGLIYLYNFNTSGEYPYCTYDTGYANTGYSDTTGLSGGANLSDTTNCNGIALVTGTGYEINSGTFTLYRLV